MAGRSAGASRHSIGYMQRRSCHVLAARPIASIGPALVNGFSAVADERCRTDKLDGVIKHRSSRETTMVGRGAALDGLSFPAGPMVRIRFPPAGSLQTFGPSRTALPHLNYTAFPGGGRSFTSIWDDSRIGYNILCEIERSADSWRGCWSPWATLPGQLLAGALVATEA